MKIVQIIPNYDLGGIQKAGCVLASGMAAAGHEAVVVGQGTGPRFLATADGGSRLRHIALADMLPETVLSAVCMSNPDVVHIHSNRYEEPLIRLLHQRFSGKGPLVVSTPVFGRPPDDRAILGLTRTCCVGLYTFYRLCRWLGFSFDQALKAGLSYVPLTPFEPPQAALGPRRAAAATARASLGLPPDAFIVGRIGRATPSKWAQNHEAAVDTLLTRLPQACWLSVGYPEECGRSRLETRWPGRFFDFPQTADYEFLTKTLSAMDVCLFFSRHGECFASSICEAVCLGTPVVARCTPFNDNGQAEQVIDGTTGYLVGSPEQAAAVLVSLQADPARLAALQASTQQYGLARWHLNRVTDDLLSLYRWYEGGATGALPYADVMRAEYVPFAAGYKARVASVMAAASPAALLWPPLLGVVESWPLFQAGRFVKTLRQKVRK